MIVLCLFSLHYGLKFSSSSSSIYASVCVCVYFFVWVCVLFFLARSSSLFHFFLLIIILLFLHFLCTFVSVCARVMVSFFFFSVQHWISRRRRTKSTGYSMLFRKIRERKKDSSIGPIRSLFFANVQKRSKPWIRCSHYQYVCVQNISLVTTIIISSLDDIRRGEMNQEFRYDRFAMVFFFS